MAFQAPFDIVDMRRQQFLEQQAAQEQEQARQQQLQGTLMGALGDIASMYQKNQEMEAGVKAGEMFGKTFAKQFGFDASVFNSPEYKSLPMQAKYQFLNQGVLGNFGSLTQAYNYGQNASYRQQQPYVNAAATNARDVVSQGGSGAVGATRRIPQGY